MTDDATPSGLLTPAEVAAIFRVGVRTVASWARDGRLASVETPGGHRRFRSEDVEAFTATRAEPRATPASRKRIPGQSYVSRLIVDRMVREMEQRPGRE